MVEGKSLAKSHVGRMHFNGAGTGNGGSESNAFLGVNDGAAVSQTLSGRYTVDSNCRGTITANYQDGASATFSIVVVGGGTDFLYVARDAANSVYQGSGSAINR